MSRRILLIVTQISSIPLTIGHFPSELEVRHSSYRLTQYGKIYMPVSFASDFLNPSGQARNQTLLSLLTNFETLRLGSPGKDTKQNSKVLSIPHPDPQHSSNFSRQISLVVNTTWLMPCTTYTVHLSKAAKISHWCARGASKKHEASTEK